MSAGSCVKASDSSISWAYRSTTDPEGANMRESAGKGGILMLLGNNPYPQDPRVRREATALVDAGYRVTVICPRVRGQAARETVRGVHVLRYRQRVDAR